MTIPWSLQILAAMTVLEDASKRERSHGAPPALEITMSTFRRKDGLNIFAARAQACSNVPVKSPVKAPATFPSGRSKR
jgi:hypothetical protein